MVGASETSESGKPALWFYNRDYRWTQWGYGRHACIACTTKESIPAAPCAFFTGIAPSYVGNGSTGQNLEVGAIWAADHDGRRREIVVDKGPDTSSTEFFQLNLRAICQGDDFTGTCWRGALDGAGKNATDDGDNV